jgi:hypothetical protein
MLDNDVPLDRVTTWRILNPLERHHLAAVRWTLEQGQGSAFGGSSVQHPNLGWMTEAGIPDTFHRRLELEFQAAGVTIDEARLPARR